VPAAASQKGEFPRYSVESASVFYKNGSGAFVGSQVDKAVMTLNPEKIQALSEGEFTLYLSTFAQFYASEAYSEAGLPLIEVKDVSGGISLPVLAMLGAIESINSIPLDTSTEEGIKAFQEAMLVVAVGFGDTVIENVSPQAPQNLREWEWLAMVTKYALNLE